jgi:hypothetical protein
MASHASTLWHTVDSSRMSLPGSCISAKNKLKASGVLSNSKKNTTRREEFLVRCLNILPGRRNSDGPSVTQLKEQSNNPNRPSPLLSHWTQQAIQEYTLYTG